MNIQISTYEDYLEITEGTRQRLDEIDRIQMTINKKRAEATNEGWCFKHPTYNINPKYGKCNACRIEDGDIVKCKTCEINYHNPKWVQCYQCSFGVIEYTTNRKLIFEKEIDQMLSTPDDLHTISNGKVVAKEEGDK